MHSRPSRNGVDLGPYLEALMVLCLVPKLDPINIVVSIPKNTTAGELINSRSLISNHIDHLKIIKSSMSHQPKIKPLS